MRPVRIAILMYMVVFLSAVVGAEAKSIAKPAENKASAKAPASPVDLNSASQQELEKLPGVGPAAAKKIIAGRPYSSIGELSKTGIPAKTIGKITSMVTVGKSTAAQKPAATAVPASNAVAPGKPAKVSVPTSAAKENAPPVPPPAGKDMVWVNSDSKVFHKAGSRWYGKTKKGSYMKESDAIKAGFRESKN